MEIDNPLKMNDWEIMKFLKIIIAIQFALFGAIGLEIMGLGIPILRQLVGLIYLSFIPGIIIIRILNLHKLSAIETILYAVGLSLFTVMFTGFFMNLTYPSFGITRPISLYPLVVTLSLIIFVLSLLCYIRDGDFSDSSYIKIREILTPPILFLCLIPFISVIGTHMVNYHHTNILLMLMIIIIVIIVFLIMYEKFIPKYSYPLAVWIITCLLYTSPSPRDRTRSRMPSSA